MFSASLSGDFGKLEAFGNRVAGFGSPAMMTQIAKEIGDEALNQVQVGFSQQRDPYGNPWFPKVIPDGRSILRGSSGKLERGFRRLNVSANSVTIGTRVPEARFQFGTGIYGPSHKPIMAKGRALRIPTGVRGRGTGGRFTSGGMFFRSVKGARARLMMPLPHRNSIYWGKAFQSRVSAVLRARLAGSSGGVR